MTFFTIYQCQVQYRSCNHILSYSIISYYNLGITLFLFTMDGYNGKRQGLKLNSEGGKYIVKSLNISKVISNNSFLYIGMKLSLDI